MTITPVGAPAEGHCSVSLPSKPYIALRLQRVS